MLCRMGGVGTGGFCCCINIQCATLYKCSVYRLSAVVHIICTNMT